MVNLLTVTSQKKYKISFYLIFHYFYTLRINKSPQYLSNTNLLNMRNLKLIGLLWAVLLLGSCAQEKHQTEVKTDSNGYSYEIVKDDPLQARIYTLDNGLKVFLARNEDEPRIQTLIAVRAGSVDEPQETTGLAHYFEHMMFKGTSKIGTLDWDKEKVLLDQISDLFEKHRATSDPEEKKALYHQIDSISGEAAKYVASNEYDKLISSLGGKGTNAGTSYDQTVYINNIPTNELSKWAELESERFANIVLRVFHTELETVYEEYNMYQDMDNSRLFKTLMTNLFKNHPYGRSVIGLPEHIKNPSMVNIYNFAHQFYVPNNMAIALSGELDYEATIKTIDEFFGPLKKVDVPQRKGWTEEPITEPIEKEIFGPDAESLEMAFRFDGFKSDQRKYVTMIDNILSNSRAGLIDLDLNQAQKVLSAGSGAWFMRDFGIHTFNGTPRQGQTLEEVKDLLLSEIEKVKTGDFDDWMLEAVVNDMRLNEIRRRESNYAVASNYVSSFVQGVSYADMMKFYDDLETITKEELVNFAKTHYNNNYVVVYKRIGENKDSKKVDKPAITAVPINREAQSEFATMLTSKKAEPIKPQFIDFKDKIATEQLTGDVPMYYIENKTNELFTLVYMVDMGRDNDKLLSLAVNYLPYLGTDKYTPAQLQQEFFRLGLRFDVNTSDDQSYVFITGLKKSFDQGAELLEHLITNVQPDETAYNDYVKGILKERDDKKKNKGRIMWGAMLNYGMYGSFSPFTNIISAEELQTINPETLTNKVKEIFSYKHSIFYYGQESMDAIKGKLTQHHAIAADLKDPVAPVIYEERNFNTPTVYIVDYDMVQANILLMSKDAPMDIALYPESRMFNEYYGSGLSSIVFQEIREARSLAYSSMATYTFPRKPNRSHFVIGFVGTQADKLETATETLLDLMNKMPRAEKQYDLAKENIIKNIQTERITKENIFWKWKSYQDMGVDYDLRKDAYDKIPEMSFDQFETFFNQHIAGKHYSFLVLGKKENLDLNALGKLGTIKELSLQEIFNY